MQNTGTRGLPRPDFAHLVMLADEVLATLKVGIGDEDQRALLVGEARDLIDRIRATLVEIEEANPTWAGWGSIEPPLGTMVERTRRRTLQPFATLQRS